MYLLFTTLTIITIYPGLSRGHDPGYLTPVFFNIEVLLKFETHQIIEYHLLQRRMVMSERVMIIEDLSE